MLAPEQPIEETYFYIQVAIASVLGNIAIFYLASWLLPNCSSTFQRMTLKQRSVIMHNVPSYGHAAIVCFLATYALWTETAILNDYVWGKSVMASVACAITVGYMFGDLFLLILHWDDVGDWAVVFHHITSGLSFVFIIIVGCYRFFAMIRLLAEYSTFFVNARAILYDLGMQNSKAYFYNGLLMVFSFTFARIIPFPIYVYCIYSVTGTESFELSGSGRYVVWGSTIVLDTLNVIWYRKMILGAIKVWNKNKMADAQSGIRVKDKRG